MAADGRQPSQSITWVPATPSPAMRDADGRPIATAAQIVAARKLIGWRSFSLARKAGVTYAALVDAQIGSVLRPEEAVTVRATLRAAQRALERAGVEFTAPDGEKNGVTLRAPGT